MSERKMDRFAALGKDVLSLGIDDDMAAAAAIGFVDESKDQQHLDNSIPLSPQWLYAKPTDAKVCDALLTMFQFRLCIWLFYFGHNS
jgi:PERQ amino acid-rich with GYF domain-containing protein